MNLLICLLVSTIILTIFEKGFRKRPYLLYLGTILIGVLGSFFSLPFSVYITRGAFATSLFVIVMYARVLPTKSRFYRTFMSLRAPIAIGASFLIFFHNGKTLYSYIKAYVLFGAVLRPHEIYAAICSAIMFLLLLPLTVTSFMPIRKKMKAITWKKIQKTSYLFYFLIYAHISFLFLYQIQKGRNHYAIDLAIYTFLFANYLFLRLALWAKTKKKTNLSQNLKRYGISMVTVVSVVLTLWGSFMNVKPTTIQAESTPLADSSHLYEENLNNDSQIHYLDGEYTGEAMGYNGMIRVKVMIINGEITELNYISYEDDEAYFQSAWKNISTAILHGEAVNDVDTVSGATFSSKGILSAVKNALENAN